MIEKYKPQAPGFEVFLTFEGWKAAFITHSADFSQAGFCEMKRHRKTDEWFFLPCGRAALYTREEAGGATATCVLEPESAYNVKRDTWHDLAVSPGGLAAVAENSNTAKENSERMKLHAER